MKLKFVYQQETNLTIGTIYRPTALVSFWSTKKNRWVETSMIVDSGADYTIVPHFLAKNLGIDLEEKAFKTDTKGVGGTRVVYFIPKLRARIGTWERIIPIGFLETDEIPPLLGRHLFLETFEVQFHKNHTLEISE